jgi:putative aminopeptidase FrvX
VPAPDLLLELLQAHGPSGHEHLAHEVVREALEEGVAATSDTVGNLVVRRRGAEGPPALALFAHLDVIGLAVSHVRESGLLAVHKLAAWPPAVAYGQRVEIRTRNGPVHGVVARSVSDSEKVEWDQLYVDVGARDREEALALVEPGDPMVCVAPPVELANGRVASRNADNRASVYVALEAFRQLAPDVDVALVAGAQEELGHAGARTAAHALRPRVALALDVTYATDVPSGDADEAGEHTLGGGPAIFRGPAINPRVFELLREAARAEGIAHTVETGSSTFTDGDDTFSSRDGVATGVVSVPLRYMHSTIETFQLSDLEDTIRLVVAFGRALRPGLDFAR